MLSRQVSPPCRLDKLELCSADQRAYIEEWQKKTEEEREKETAFLEKKISNAQTAHDQLLSDLQSQFERSQQKLADVKSEMNGKIGLLGIMSKAAAPEPDPKPEL